MNRAFLILAAAFVAFYLFLRPDQKLIAVGGRLYRVRNGQSAASDLEAATHLSLLTTTIKHFLAITSSPLVDRIAAQWDGDISEARLPGHTDAKRRIAICVRHPRTGQVQDLNDSMFVVLHELAHVGTPDHGHTPLFWENFRKLLDLAVGANVYTHIPYDETPTCFCGTLITHNPGSRR